MARRRVAVLISGGGSNLQALIDASARYDASAEIVLVVSNRPGVQGLARAARAGIDTALVEHRSFAGRPDFEAAVDARLRDARVDLVCLAGFMRILTTGFVERWHNRLINIHPSLLPSFPGLHTHARALAAGVQAHGCTVHLVRPEVDTGPILVQGLVPVRPADDEPTLAARVLELEHRCYPLALELLASGAIAANGDRVVGDGPRLVLHPSLTASVR
jgi:phosphoribosylglycinamide formyltransferase-1